MRKISGSQISQFSLLFAVTVGLDMISVDLLVRREWVGEFYAVAVVASLVALLYGWAIVVYRLYLKFCPLPTGSLPPGSKAETTAQVNALFYLIFFNSLIRTEFLPIPVKTLVYAALGSKIGHNSFSPGTLLDPPLTTLGDNTIVGHGATVYAHAIEGENFGLYPVILGSNVTVGAGAIIMPDVTVGDAAIISAGAVVRKGERIGAGQVWGGVPARYLGEVGGASAS